MASRPLLYITDNMLRYWAIWSAVSYSSLLDILLPLLSCTVSSYCTHSLHFRSVPSPSKNVLFGYVFTFSEKRVPLRDVFRPIPLRFLMWIMITKVRLGFQPILSWCCLCRFSLTLLRVYQHPFVSGDCKRLLCFCESLLRVGGIHSCSFDNLGLFFNRLRGPRP